MHDTFANKANDIKYYEEARKSLIEKANNENWLFEPNRPIISIIEYIENINLLTSASAGVKIKKIGKIK
jgi:hypothetical protein